MIRVVQMGLGPIGKAIATRVVGDGGLELVGAVDPALAGQDVGQLLGGEASGTRVCGSLSELSGLDAEVVLHATGSFLTDTEQQFLEILGQGMCVVSTCEELAYPFYRHPALSRSLDAAATGKWRPAGVEHRTVQCATRAIGSFEE